MKLLERLLTTETASLIKGLRLILKELYPIDKLFWAEHGHYIYAMGEAPICLVAHVDTIDNPYNIRDLRINNNSITLSTSSFRKALGADDRAGVWLILKLISRLHKENKPLPSIVFTSFEEVGAQGARAFIKDFPTPGNPVKYIVGLDRQGKNDAVFYSCRNKEFKNYICSFGFKEQKGTYSDISFIGPTWDIANVNLSIGYKHEHTELEKLNLKHLIRTYNKILEMYNDIYSADWYKCQANTEAWELLNYLGKI